MNSLFIRQVVHAWAGPHFWHCVIHQTLRHLCEAFFCPFTSAITIKAISALDLDLNSKGGRVELAWNLFVGNHRVVGICFKECVTLVPCIKWLMTRAVWRFKMFRHVQSYRKASTHNFTFVWLILLKSMELKPGAFYCTGSSPFALFLLIQPVVK